MKATDYPQHDRKNNMIVNWRYVGHAAAFDPSLPDEKLIKTFKKDYVQKEIFLFTISTVQHHNARLIRVQKEGPEILKKKIEPEWWVLRNGYISNKQKLSV